MLYSPCVVFKSVPSDSVIIVAMCDLNSGITGFWKQDFRMYAGKKKPYNNFTDIHTGILLYGITIFLCLKEW